MSDLIGIIPSITGKIELVYEGEQEGPYQVAFHLLDKAIRSQFVQYFPNPEQQKKRKQEATDNPYKSITNWFDKGNQLSILMNTKDEDKIHQLYNVDGLYPLVKKYFKAANEQQAALLMEFVLHGLASYSLISKKVVEGRVDFNDLMGSIIDLKGGRDSDEDEDFDGEDFT